MLSFSGSLKVFVAIEPCDMRNNSEIGIRNTRKGCNGLHALASERLGEVAALVQALAKSC